MYGRPLDEEKYDSSRWITEPFHLYDCCQENDGAAGMVLVSAERAAELKIEPYETVAEMLPHVDYLTVHTPLTPETKNLISAKQIETMRPGVRLMPEGPAYRAAE